MLSNIVYAILALILGFFGVVYFEGAVLSIKDRFFKSKEQDLKEQIAVAEKTIEEKKIKIKEKVKSQENKTIQEVLDFYKNRYKK